MMAALPEPAESPRQGVTRGLLPQMPQTWWRKFEPMTDTPKIDSIASESSVTRYRARTSKVWGNQISHTAEIYRNLFGRPGESDEARAFRRFPITGQKIGGYS